MVISDSGPSGVELERYLKNLREKEFVLTSHRLAHPPYLFKNQPEKGRAPSVGQDLSI